MKKAFAIYISCFFAMFTFAQSKDSLTFYKKFHDVPVKYKLEHFDLKGNVKSFYESSTLNNDHDLKVIYEFDTNGNLIQVVNSYGIVSKKFNYNSEGKLISFTTNSKIKRDIEVGLDDNGNIVKLIINNEERGISTLLNEYNKKGVWTKQIHEEENSILQENVYENDIKLIKVLIYINNEVSETTNFSYEFFSNYVKIKQVSNFKESGYTAITCIYVDYNGTFIYGDLYEGDYLTSEQVDEIVSNFQLDHNENWIKNQQQIRVITYY